MEYTKRNFIVLDSDASAISVECAREDLWQYPLCKTAIRLMDEDCTEFEINDNEYNTCVRPCGGRYDANSIARFVRDACNRCAYNIQNKCKTR